MVILCTYFMTAIDGVFCLGMRVINRRERVSTVTLDWSEIWAVMTLQSLWSEMGALSRS